jgi:hypothetical protein
MQVTIVSRAAYRANTRYDAAGSMETDSWLRMTTKQ